MDITSALQPCPRTKERLALVAQGKYKLVYVAPERLRKSEWQRIPAEEVLRELNLDAVHLDLRAVEVGHIAQ